MSLSLSFYFFFPFILLRLTENTSVFLPGNQVLPQMVQAALSHDFVDIISVQEHRGEPDGLIVCHLPFGATAYFGMSNAVLRHDTQGKPWERSRKLTPTS